MEQLTGQGFGVGFFSFQIVRYVDLLGIFFWDLF